MDVLLVDAGDLGDVGADHVLQLRDRLDAGEAPADEDEGQQPAAPLGVPGAGGVVDAREHPVAQRQGLLDLLEAHGLLGQARDGQGAGLRAQSKDEVVISLTACGRSNDSKSSDLSGEVVIAGSTSVQPLSEELAKEFMKEHGDVKVTVQGGGSGQGIKSIEEKIADIGSLSRDVKDEEKKSVNKEYTIAKDGVPAVVCTDVDIDDISLKQLKDIYTGKITNWKDVGGKDKKYQ